ncbi:MAG: formyltetrahydrofolate deformylase, partial [Arthrobacter koreensis]|nr:formyltetrahydrofolate deformylase [Arthrobacter koreensis]
MREDATAGLPASPVSPSFDDGAAAGSGAYTLTLSCADRPGIVHAVSGALAGAGGNITESQQYGSPDSGTFFMRVDFTAPGTYDGVRSLLAPVAGQFGMDWELHRAGVPVRTLIMASKDGHCLNDLLFQQRAGNLPIEIPAIVSNHRDLAGLAEFYGIPFHHIPVTADTKQEAEDQLRTLMAELDIELVVLARYMQILSNELCQ